MDRNKKNASILMLLMAAVILLVVGCSTDRTPLGPAAAPAESHSISQGNVPYPPLNDVLAHMPSGYRALSVVASGLDDHRCDSIATSRLCRDEMTQTVQLGTLVSVRISRGDLARDTTVSIIAPSGCVAAADFYPHPYLFNGTVEITWNIQALNLPHGFDYSQIVPWYVTEDGQFVPLQYNWIGNHDFLVVYTNHFSRYILGGPDA